MSLIHRMSTVPKMSDHLQSRIQLPHSESQILKLFKNLQPCGCMLALIYALIIIDIIQAEI